MLRDFFTVQVRTDQGIEGIGVTAFGGKLVRSLKAALEDFGELINGDDPLRTEQIIAKLRAASASCGSGGIAMLAISAIDFALWDIRGKAFGIPLAQLLGGPRDKVPAYASGALMRTSRRQDRTRRHRRWSRRAIGRSRPRWRWRAHAHARDRAHPG